MKRMIAQRDGHPSVITWVAFDEGWGQYEQARIADYVEEGLHRRVPRKPT